MNKLKTWTASVLAAGIGLLMLNGCVGYRVGSMLPNDVKSVYIPTFLNSTDEPLIELDATQAAIEQFQRDGSLKLADEDEADAVLTVELTSYRLEPVSFEKDRRYAAEQYRIVLDAKMSLRRTVDDSVVVQAPRVRGKFIFDVEGDLSSSKLDAAPGISEDLARNLVQYLVEYWP